MVLERQLFLPNFLVYILSILDLLNNLWNLLIGLPVTTHSLFKVTVSHSISLFSISLAIFSFLLSCFLPLLPFNHYPFLSCVVVSLIPSLLTPLHTPPPPSHPSTPITTGSTVGAPSTGNFSALWAGSAVARGDCILEVWVVWQKRMVAVSHGWILKLCFWPWLRCTGEREAVKLDKNKQRAKGEKMNDRERRKSRKSQNLDSWYQNSPFALLCHPSTHPCINSTMKQGNREEQEEKLKHKTLKIDLEWEM